MGGGGGGAGAVSTVDGRIWETWTASESLGLRDAELRTAQFQGLGFRVLTLINCLCPHQSTVGGSSVATSGNTWFRV